MSSSARRERWTAQVAAAERVSRTKSRSATASRELGGGASKAGSLARAGGEEEGLGSVQVRVAGEEGERGRGGRHRRDACATRSCRRAGLALGEGEEGRLGGADFGEAGVDLIAGPEAEVGGDLVVARAAGVELLAEVADGLDEFGFDPGV